MEDNRKLRTGHYTRNKHINIGRFDLEIKPPPEEKDPILSQSQPSAIGDDFVCKLRAQLYMAGLNVSLYSS